MLEGVYGQPVTDILGDRFGGPFRLGTLQAENLADTKVRRSVIYTRTNGVANVEIDRDNLSWKVLGGGMEASVYDLARFGAKLTRGEILDGDGLAQPVDPTQRRVELCLRLEHRHRPGPPGVAKNGAQAGALSYLRIYPDDDVVIVVLSNRRNGGHSAVHLGRDIGTLIINELNA